MSLPSSGLRPRFLASLQESEGFSQEPYQDTQGVWTVGYGHKLGRKTPAAGEYTKLFLERLFLQDVQKAEREASALFEEHSIEILQIDNRINQASAIWYTVVEMTFILGKHGCAGFHNFWKALAASNLPAAAEELRTSSTGGPSPWFQEEPGRVEKLCNRLLNGF